MNPNIHPGVLMASAYQTDREFIKAHNIKRCLRVFRDRWNQVGGWITKDP